MNTNLITKFVQVELENVKLHAKLLAPVVVIIDGDLITVPVGYETDFASVPQVLWNILPPVGSYTVAAVVHDYLYSTHIFTKEKSDSVFYELMRLAGTKKTWAKLMYYAVKLFGKSAWNSGPTS